MPIKENVDRSFLGIGNMDSIFIFLFCLFSNFSAVFSYCYKQTFKYNRHI